MADDGAKVDHRKTESDLLRLLEHPQSQLGCSVGETKCKGDSMIILGLNAYHGDSAACLVRDGKIIAAVEEERFRRIKHWAGFPSLAIKYCLREGGLSVSDIDIIAVNSNPTSAFLKKIKFTLRNRPDLGLIADRLRNQAKRQSVEADLQAEFPRDVFRGQFQRVEHHSAHLASAFLVSPFSEACIASIDGFGDFCSAAWGAGSGTSMEIDGRVYFPHSLGVFYQAITQFIGFPHYGDEYKVMGLAPYGEPKYLAAMREIVRLKDRGHFELDTRFFRHHREKIDYAWTGGSPHVGTLFSPSLEEFLGPPRGEGEPLGARHRDLACSAQAMYEEAFFHLIGHLYREHKLSSLALAGGCAMNSVANGKVLRNSSFKRLYVQSAAGDAGGAVGAAIFAWHSKEGRSSRLATSSHRSSVLEGDVVTGRTVMDHAQFGPAATDCEISSLLRSAAKEIVRRNCEIVHIADETRLCRETAEAIARGGVVGWFQGRMEWGPRALGNRSILGDPRRADMKEILNIKIKRRESFRPFAPSIQKEHVPLWFEEDGDVPFMMQVYQIREERRSLVPAVTHVDGSGRLQTVYRKTTPRYWSLIEAFRAITSVPMVLNTSFNENEPIVCRPEEALDCFMRTQMDVLVLGDWLVRRVPC